MVARPDVFQASEQGLLNYLLLKRWQDRTLTLRHEEFMWWSGWLPPGQVSVADLQRRRDFSVLLHWAGPKPATLAAMQHAEILTFYNELFYSRIPQAYINQIAQSENAARQRKRKLRSTAQRMLREHARRQSVD